MMKKKTDAVFRCTLYYVKVVKSCQRMEFSTLLTVSCSALFAMLLFTSTATAQTQSAFNYRTMKSFGW